MMWCVKRSSPTLVSAGVGAQPPLAAVCALIAIAVTGGAAACVVGEGRVRRCADGPRRCRGVPDCLRRAGRRAVRDERDDGVASGGVRRVPVEVLA